MRLHAGDGRSNDMTTDLPQVPPVTLGRSGVRSTKLALGSANWIGRVGDDAYVELLREAFRLGIRHVDTAPSYEQGWLAERLREADPPDDLLIVTKIGRYRADDGVEYDFGPDRAVRSVHDSLEELGLEHLPVLKLHDARPDHWDQIMAPNGHAGRVAASADRGTGGRDRHGGGQRGFRGDGGGERRVRHHRLLPPLHPAQPGRGAPHSSARTPAQPGRDQHQPVWRQHPGHRCGAVGRATATARLQPEVLNAVRDMETRRAEAHGLDLQTAALAYSLACPDIDVNLVGPTTIEELHADVAARDGGGRSSA